jgi:quercetin dioxygenase-like cupin family protein
MAKSDLPPFVSHAAPEGPEIIRRAGEPAARWDGVPVLAYKEDETTPFKSVTRQVLFSSPDLKGELRYFEVAAGGFSTLERHHHVHGVMIFRGKGTCLVGDRVTTVAQGDLVYIPPSTWHQFRATTAEPLGFLCLVDATRDKPELPTAEALAELRRNPVIKAFLES